MVWTTMTTRINFIEVIFIFLLSIVVSNTSGESSECRLCKTTRVHKMKATDCYRKELHQFPKCLSTDSEVLELSVNRIRKINKSDLSRFSYLKLLYLTDNLLVKLDDDLFEDLTDLTTLDMSLNALAKLPPSVFQLPSLKSLYLSQNWNINIVDAVEKTRPIRSPLTQMDLSQTSSDDDPQEFPEFGILPYLTILNISLNKYTLLTPRQFMGFCKLQVLGSANVTVDFDEPCNCWAINDWLKSKGVKFTPFGCPVLKTYCKNLTYQPEDLKLWDDCEKTVAEINTRNVVVKAVFGVGIGLIIALLIVAFIVYKKWRTQRNRKPPQNEFPSKAGISLLSTPHKSVPNEYTL